MKNLTDNELRRHLTSEAGQIPWHELQRYFARGVVINVALQMDLVEVAAKFIQDDKIAVKAWLNEGLIAYPTDDEARRWANSDLIFLAVVTAPWVLI